MKPRAFLASLVLFALPACSQFFPKEAGNTRVPQTETAEARQAAEEAVVPKRRILLLEFLNHSPYQESALNRSVWDQIRNKIAQNPQFTVVTEEEFGSSLPHAPDASDYDLSAVFRLARNQGVSGVVGGIIRDVLVSETGDEVGLFRSRHYVVEATVNLRLFDTRSETEIYNRTETAQVTEELTTVFGSRTPTASDPDRVKGAVAKAVDKLSDGLPPFLKRVEWVGRIAKIDLHRYYINAGELSGIRVGQLLKVYGEGTPVRDESTNTFLGVAPGPFKGILKVVDYFGGDGAVAVIHSGAGFRERDRVEMLAAPK